MCSVFYIYTVTWNANVYGDLGADGQKITQTYKYGETLQDAPKVSSKTGYTFEYWVDQDGNKVTELPEKVTGNTTYTAVWKHKDEVSIVLHVIIGAVISAAVTVPLLLKKKKHEHNN